MDTTRMDENRQRIVAAARARFRHYGIQKTTMQEIAQDAGLAVGTLYRYFRDKDDLVVAGAEDFAARHRKLIERIVASTASPDRKLRQYIIHRYRDCKEAGTSSQHAAEVVRAVIRLRPERLQEEGIMMFETIQAILQQGRRKRLFKIQQIPREAKVFLLAITSFFPIATSAPAQWPRESDLRMLVNWFLETWRSRARK